MGRKGTNEPVQERLARLAGRQHGMELEGRTVETDETRPRVDTPHVGSPHTHDAVLRARRSS